MVARSELILRWSVYGAAGLLVCLVQGLILQRLDLWGAMPFLYPALAAMVAVWEGAVPCGAVYALCLGAACDLALPGGIPCFYTIAFPLAAMLAGLLTRGWLSSNLLSALAASALSPLLGDAVIAEMTCVGSLLIVALSFNNLGMTKIKIMNLLPAIFLPILLCRSL